MDQLLDDPADEELQPSERVFGNVEMLDMVMSFLDQKSLGKARIVCKQWREVAELSLKRRLMVSRVEPISLSSFPFFAHHRISGLQRVNFKKTVSVNLRNNETRKYKQQDFSALPSEDVHLAFFENVELLGRSSRSGSLITATALVVTTAMKLDWLPLVTQLTLYDTLTAAEWAKVGLIIVGKFKSLETLSMTIPWNDNRKVVSQCYAELLKQEYASLKVLSFSCLKNLSAQVTQSMHDWKFPGFDVVRRSPVMQNFNIEYRANAAREELEVRYSAEESTYYLNCRISEEYENQFTAIVSSFVNVAVTSLGSQQLASIERVSLEKCISKDDWKTGAAFQILEKFFNLRHLSVTSTCIYRPEVESKNTSRDSGKIHSAAMPTLSQLESLEVRYASMGPKFRVSIADCAARFPHGVSLAFLEKCPNLTSFAFSASASFKPCEPFQSSLEATRPEAYGGIKHGWIYNKMESSFDTSRDESSGLAAAMDSLTMDVINLIRPAAITTSSSLEIIAHLLSMDYAAAVETLNLSFRMSSLPAPVNVKADELDTVFRNVKKLSLTAEGGLVMKVNKVERIPLGFVFENATSFIFWPKGRYWGADSWKPLMRQAQRNLYKMVPNVRIFVTSFLNAIWMPTEDPNSLNSALQVAKSFDKLQHLVLAAKDRSDYRETLDDVELNCLAGLSSLTIIIRSNSMKDRYTQLFAKACARVPSIQKLNVYYPEDSEDRDDSEDSDDDSDSEGDEVNESDEQEDNNDSAEQDADDKEGGQAEKHKKMEHNGNIEINPTGVTRINDNLTVTCGPISELQGKALFDGIEDSKVDWEEIIKYSLQQPYGR